LYGAPCVRARPGSIWIPAYRAGWSSSSTRSGGTRPSICWPGWTVST